MHKTFALLICIAVGTAIATPNRHIQRGVVPITKANNGIDWCPQCINSFNDLIEIVLQVILDSGVLSTCADLCSIVADKTGSEILGIVCTFGCEILGIEEFAKLVQEADLDPIYYCERVKLCPSKASFPPSL